jgi:hypothetical protein
MGQLHYLRILGILLLPALIATAQPAGEIFTVHGRLISGNGTPSCRIWVVGSNRKLGVRELQDETPDMPESLLKLLAYGRSEDYRAVYADFQVEALTPDKPDHMRMVRVISASKIVVTNGKEIIIMKDSL